MCPQFAGFYGVSPTYSLGMPSQGSGHRNIMSPAEFVPTGMGLEGLEVMK